MDLTLKHWRDLSHRFDPTKRLEEVDDDLFVERPGSVARRIITELELSELEPSSEPPGKWVVCGSMGSGKSSELVRIGRELWRSHTVIALDLSLSSPRADKLTPAEVLLLIGAAGLSKARDNGHSVPSKVERHLVDAFRPLVDPRIQKQINVGEVLQGVALFISNMVAPGVPSVKDTTTGAARIVGGILGGTTRPVQEGEPAIRELSLAVNQVFEFMKGKAFKPPVVLVDGLDKVQDLPTIRNLFTDTRLLTAPQVPIIYSGPITLMVSTFWNTAGNNFTRERLTNVVVHPPQPGWVTLEDMKIQQGRQTMRQVVERRLARSSLALADVFEGHALDELITASGGVLRDLIQLINRCCRSAYAAAKGEGGGSVKIDSRIATEVVAELRKEFEITLTTRSLAELRHVKETGEPSGSSEVSSELLLNNYVLPYSNGKVWYEPHPLLQGVRPDL